MSKRQKKFFKGIVIYGLVALVMAIVLIPIWWMISSSLKPDDRLFTYPPSIIPTKLTSLHYDDLLRLWPFASWYLNSIKVAVLISITTVILAAPAGYSISRLRYHGKNLILILILFSYLFPGFLLIVPLFLIVKTLGLYNTNWSLVLVYNVLTVPFGIYLLRAFFDGIPVELEEQAMVDGANQLSAFLRITIPLAVPGITACAIYAFIVAYSEFLYAFVFLSTDSVMTLPAGLGLLAMRSDIPWGQLMAACTLVAVPCIIFFLAIQKYFIRGLMGGAVKG